ncbi:hypothetical protein KG088_18010 [Halomonas sp. TRM85114]|uniref:hypothetical protein n=1 Tax=Halomonas jincaotanensis TaxID=2810616 RepID=UPI001BD55DB1|nr:hypothetical protein [Halomonas jincaotanensis]MBS9405502.1 hypothetical protein [Halomonas jincaotanensis]
MDKIITTSELERRSTGELAALFCRVAQDAAQHAPGTRERRNAIVSLDNICRALAAHKPPSF